MNAVAIFATLFLLLLSTTCALCEDSIALRCPLNQRRLYRYEALVNSFGPSPQNDTENNAERFYLHSEVGLTCFYSIPKPNKKSLLFWQVDMKNVFLTMEEKSPEDGWTVNTTRIAPNAVPSDQLLDEHFSRFTAFVSTSNGKTVTVIMSKSEPEWVKSIKKGIMSQLQVKLTGNKRTEKDAHGEHVSHYTKKRLQGGGMLLRKKYSENDLLSSTKLLKAGRMRRRDMRLNSRTDVKLDENGLVETVLKLDNINFGENSEKMHKVFKINRRIPFARRNTYQSKMTEDPLRAEGVSALIYETTTESDYEYKNYLVPPSTESIEALSEDEMQSLSNDVIASQTTLLSDEYQFENLEVSNLKKYTRRLRREFAKKNMKIDDMLTELEDNPADMNLAARVAQYVQTVPSKRTLGKLLSAFQKNRGREDASSEKALEFAKLIQTLLTSSRTKTGQKILIDNTFDNPELVIHAIFRTLGIKKPIPSIEPFLRKFMTYSSEKADNQTISHIRLNAYLALADLASRLNSDKAARIVDIIVQNVNTAKDSNELLLHVHALGNAGSKAPLKLLQKLITRNTEDVKSAAIQALRKRTETLEDSAVTKLIHKVVAGKFSPTLKSEAVTVQTERERAMRTGSSVKFFMRHFLDVASERIAKRLDKNAAVSFTTDPQVKSAMLEYFYTVGSKKAGDIVSTAVYFRDPVVLSLLGFSTPSNDTTMGERIVSLSDSESLFAQYDDSSDLVHPMSESGAMFFGSVWDAVTDAAKKFGKAVETIYDKARNALKDNTEVWRQASFAGKSKSCVPAGNSQLCMYDSDMMSFIRGQGSLAAMTKNRFYTYEELYGAQKLHVYVGAVGFAGTSFNCKAPPSSFQYSIFARAAAKAHIFGRDVHLLTGSFENGFQNGVRRDKVYLRVFNSVMYDRSLINKEFTVCDSRAKQLVYKDFPELLSFRTTVVVVVVPVEFSVKAFGQFDLTLQYDYCINNLAVSGRIVPSFTLGVTGRAAITVEIAKAGVELSASLNYQVFPELSLHGLQCKVCANVFAQSKNNNVVFTGFADFNIAVVQKTFRKEIYRWQLAASPKKTLYQSCVGM